MRQKEVLLGLLMPTPISDRKLGGRDGWWEEWQSGQSIRPPTMCKWLKPSPLLCMGQLVLLCQWMHKWMREEKAVFFKWVILYSADFLPTHLPVIWAAGEKESFRNVQGRQAIWVSLANPEPISQLTQVFTYKTKKYIKRWPATQRGLGSKADVSVGLWKHSDCKVTF